MTDKNDHGGCVVNFSENFSNCGVDGFVDILDRIPNDPGKVRIMPLMGGIVDMPALMAYTMAFGEDLNKKIPLILVKKMFRELRFPGDSIKESIPQGRDSIRTSFRITVSLNGMRTRWTKALFHLGSQRGWPRLKTGMRIVSPIFYQLNAIQIVRQGSQRDIEDGYFPPCAA
jgi:hypothetical protein